MPSTDDVSQAAFRHVVVSPNAVRSAFAETRMTRWWWAAVLRLHGKPTAADVSIESARVCVAAGFRFYAWLYGVVGLAVAASSVAIGLNFESASLYWISLSVAIGMLLVASSRVAWAGAEAYRRHPAGAVPILMLFLAMVAVCLTFGLAAMSFAANDLQLVGAVTNVAALAGLVIVGIGSYAVEMAYLLHVAAAKPCE